MAHRALATNRTRSTSRRCSKEELHRKNQRAIKLLDDWMSTPDDMGAEWWTEFEADLKANRFTLRRRD